MKKRENTVAVIGLGYIGLPTALLLANSNWHVIGIDTNQDKIQSLREGKLYIQEPELDYYFKRAKLHNNFELYNELHESLASYYIIAVPTPCIDNKADLRFVWAAVDALLAILKEGDTIILESTVPIGTTEKISNYITQKIVCHREPIYVAHSPERVMPGKIVHELRHNARVIGGVTFEASQKAVALYSTFVIGDLTIVSSAMAEAVKLIENSYRDVMLACTYQVASIAQKADLDVYELIELANKHPRVQLLQPTAGVGGHCIAIDPWFLIEAFPQETKLLKTAREINNQRPVEIIEQLVSTIELWENKNNKNARVLLAGVTYKANSDDLRESPALYIAKVLLENSIDITVCEPHVSSRGLQKLLPQADIISLLGIKKSKLDIVVFLVAHNSFRAVEIEPQWQVVDFCGILHQKERGHHHETALFREKYS